MSVNTVFTRKVKTRSIISVAAVSLFLVSTGVLARSGPACHFPGPSLTEAQWADAQDAASSNGHLSACHIGKDEAWLKLRTEGKQLPSCSQQPLATSWVSAKVLWEAVGTHVQTFCGQTDKKGEKKIAISREIGGTGANEVAVGYSASAGSLSYKDNAKAVVVFQKDPTQGWFILTSYVQ